MNKLERQDAARNRPLMTQPTVAALRECARIERETAQRDKRTRALRRQDDLIARSLRRRQGQNRGKA